MFKVLRNDCFGDVTRVSSLRNVYCGICVQTYNNQQYLKPPWSSLRATKTSWWFHLRQSSLRAQRNRRSLFQDHLWVIWVTEPETTTFWFLVVAITIWMVLLPCTASSTWTWMNQLLKTGMMQAPPTLTSNLGHLCARFAMTSWRSTERLGNFSSESVVSHLVSWVSFIVSFCLWLLFVFLDLLCLALEDWPFSPLLQHVAYERQLRFDNRQSLERARHGISSKKRGMKAPLKPPWKRSSFQAPFKPLEVTLEAPFKALLKPPSRWTPIQTPLKLP